MRCVVAMNSGVIAVSFSEQGQGTIVSATQKQTDAAGEATVTVSSEQPGEQTITGTMWLGLSSTGKPAAARRRFSVRARS